MAWAYCIWVGSSSLSMSASSASSSSRAASRNGRRTDPEEQVAHGALGHLADELPHHGDGATAHDGALVGLDVPGHHPHQRGLAGPVRPHQGGGRPVRHPEGDVVEQDPAVRAGRTSRAARRCGPCQPPSAAANPRDRRLRVCRCRSSSWSSARVADLLEDEGEGGHHGHRRVLLPGPEDLGGPGGRPSPVADGQQDPDERPHHRVAERIRLHGHDGEAVRITIPAQDLHRPNGRAEVPLLAEGGEVVLADQGRRRPR